jgi:hypothetical protein
MIMATMLEAARELGPDAAAVGAYLMLWAGAREMRRAHAQPVTEGREGATLTRVWGRVSSALLRALHRLGLRTRARRAVRQGRHYSAERARRARGSLAQRHREGSTTVRELRRQLVREAAVMLAHRPQLSRASARWAHGVLS